MCGICGQFNFGTGQPASRTAVQAMTRSLAHRGPDDEGFHFSGPLGLGFRRLSIIDLSGGHQPMSDREGTVWVVFNGEIFNFPELRRELEAFGHVFRTRSDTEVIVHGYKQWGTTVLSRLHGMFGLAIWDESRKKLVLARDPAGIKLVYYRVEAGSVVFGSELRAVLAALPQRPAIDPTAMNLFLRYRYTPSPLTMYQGLRKLAPGTMAVFEKGSFRVERWHNPRPDPFADTMSDDQAAEELLDIYKRALKRHLLSDVPVGLLLSGGVDSGLLLALMDLYGKNWATYTAGYGKAEDKDDELVDAARSAGIFSARHSQVMLSQATFERSLPRIVSILEEPIASSSVVLMNALCERARQDVKVALVGQGPDELFAGYTRHLGVQYGEHWRRLPGWLRNGLQAGIGRLPRSEALKRGAYSLGIDERMRRYQSVFSLLPGDEIDALFRDGVLADGAGDSILESWCDLQPEMERCDELGAFQVLEIRSSLPDELLMFTDKISMAHGLEVRVPYLDGEVVAFAQRLPAAFKIRRGQRKWLHRRVCERFLPAEILRRKKRGFSVKAVDDWFQGPMSSELASCLLEGDSLIFKYLEPRAVSRLLAEHRSRRRDNHKVLYSLVVLEAWLRASDSEGAGAVASPHYADLAPALS